MFLSNITPFFTSIVLKLSLSVAGAFLIILFSKPKAWEFLGDLEAFHSYVKIVRVEWKPGN